ncbi:protein of unknown function [Methanoculleus bourgensis]|uniref:Uncharacterized protein n=1 Tax=Methanoculleus bourgensis TaxID=83986 RepID=A0A0X3BP39_9EURY|nr:protein of unknown function [Methanoculleus bourgensis]
MPAREDIHSICVTILKRFHCSVIFMTKRNNMHDLFHPCHSVASRIHNSLTMLTMLMMLRRMYICAHESFYFTRCLNDSITF